MSIREAWDGGEWQAHCCRLLGMKYGEDIQFIPDRVGGDGGLEAYRLDDGVVYQCYSPEDAFTAASQTEAQKDKISRDLRKLVSKPDETMMLLGPGYQIRRWVLITPAYDDKELIRYARMKSGKVRTMTPAPPWCHPDFQVVVLSDKDLFVSELASLNGMSAGSIKLSIQEVKTEEAAASVGVTLVEKLREKLMAAPLLAQDADLLDDYCDETILDYVYGKAQLQLLQDRYGVAYDAVLHRSQLTFRRIARWLASGSGAPGDIEQLVEELQSKLTEDVPALAPAASEGLARHYVASWLIDCPLRLRPAS